jgi:AcrR family transcriptional regulator
MVQELDDDRIGPDDATGPFGAPAPGFFSAEEPGRRGEILDAAMSVFAEMGYEGGSMRQIAGVVGVTEPALYRHFPGKEALFLALIRAAAGRLRAEAFALIGGVEAATFRTQLVAAFADRRRAIRFYGPVLRTVLAAVVHNPAFLKEYRAVLIDPMRERLVAKVEELDSALGVPSTPRDREERVRATMALFVGYFVTSIVMADESDEAIADAVVRVMGWEALV